MITPRRTRLVRVADLHAFRAAIASPQPLASIPLVVVPTRTAALQLAPADAVTREELYDRFHARLATPPRRLSALERDVIAQASARAAAERSPDLAFQIRPGLVAEMLRFYDQLRRQSQHVNRFEELIGTALGGDDFDRGAARMRTQTRFLADTFREYERRVAESGGCDEHTLRDRLIAEPAADPARHVIVTVPDWIADADGLYVADFDLLTRIPGLETLDIVCTEAVLRTGFHERLHNWWPGLEEVSHVGADLRVRPGLAHSPGPAHRPAPTLITPPGVPPDQPWWTVRDREEELVAIARHIRADQRRGEAAPLDRTAVVFKHPLPYLYLADEVFRSAGLAHQVSDALPLAAQPESGALDLILDAVASGFTRNGLVALLRSPHFSFDAVTRESVSALDVALSKARYLGDPERLPAATSLEAGPALEAARALARELAPLSTVRPASQQIRGLRDFWDAHVRALDDVPPSPKSGFGATGLSSRERRARAAIVEMLTALETVHAAFDDPDWSIAELAPAVRRSIEEQTFAPEQRGSGGVQLLDDQAVRYGDFDDIAVVGLVDPEWPEPPRRNIFYPPSLLKALGWPSEKDRRAAADARFLDLISSSSRRTTLFTFTLDEEALVSRSMQLDEVPRARLSAVARDEDGEARVFVDEALMLDPPSLETLDGDARAWAELRAGRTSGEAADFHGSTGTREPRAWSVSAVETYLNCPFRFFAQHVLRLEEEPDDEEVMDPKQQGILVHRVFEKFFSAWQDAGHRAVTPDNLDAARDLFAAVVERELAALPDAEAGLERTRLLGSSAAAGLGEAVLRMEAERPVAVVHRLLEHRLEGEFVIETSEGPRTLALKGKADRLDLLEDGTFRLIDYKLGWPPKGGKALQLPIYSVCAEQRLVGYRGRNWTLGEAAYLAFKGPKRVVPLFSGDKTKVLADAQERLAGAIDAINRGEFPPTPEDVWHCDTCSFSTVCRKDYVGDV